MVSSSNSRTGRRAKHVGRLFRPDWAQAPTVVQFLQELRDCENGMQKVALRSSHISCKHDRLCGATQAQIGSFQAPAAPSGVIVILHAAFHIPRSGIRPDDGRRSARSWPVHVRPGTTRRAGHHRQAASCAGKPVLDKNCRK